MTVAQRPSSEAISSDELPESVVRSLDGVGWVCLCRVLGALFASEVCYWLYPVLHICLRKKLPDYLIASSRLILLEAYLRHLDSGCVHPTMPIVGS